MGTALSQPKHENLERLRRSSGLTIKQLERLRTRFRLLDQNGVGYLMHTDLLRIPELAKNPMCHQIVNLFFSSSEGDVRLDFDKFVEVFAVIFGRSQLDRGAKLRFLTKMFDCSQSGCITRVDFQRTLRCLLDPRGSKNPEQETAPEAAAELKLLELQAFGDYTKDCISYEEFEGRIRVADIELSLAKWFSKENGDEGVDEDQPEGQTEESGLKKLTDAISNGFLYIVGIFYQKQ